MKQPFIDFTTVKKIISNYPTPFHLYDEKGIRETTRKLHQAFAWNKGFRQYFAVKATPNPVILQILREEGCGVDCSSYTELMMAQRVGFSSNDIMFSSNVTPKEDFIYARSLNAIINLDDISHIPFLESITTLPQKICCRYNPGGLFSIHNTIMDKPCEAKYGFTKQQLFEGFKELKKKGVKEFGLHAFLASNTITQDYYPTLAKILFTLAIELRQEIDVPITFINLSGGIGIPYKPEDKPIDILAVGESVRKVYEDLLIPAGMNDVALYTELGRYVLGPHGCLVTTATHKKQTHKNYIGLDACAANLMRPAMYGAYHHITVMNKEQEKCDHCYDVTGGLCENNDKFAINRMLPHIDIGDIVVIHDTGAHGFAMGYNYNGKLRSAEVLLKADGSAQLIRRPETPKDYFATLDVTGFMK